MAVVGTLRQQIITAIQNGLPICARPYENIANTLGCSSAEVIEAIQYLQQDGSMKRFGVVVKHRKLGYKANAMVVWNIEDNDVERVGKLCAKEEAVTLCYQRPRRLPHWPYNLFTMLHGKQRSEVKIQLENMIDRLKIESDHEVLFSTKCFKQRGANYQQTNQEQDS